MPHTLTRNSFIALLLPSVLGAKPVCGKPTSVKDAVRRAKSLDGKQICIRAWMSNAYDPGREAYMVTEVVGPGPSSQYPLGKRPAIGIIEWAGGGGARDLGVEGISVAKGVYKPDSFRLIEDAAASRPRPRFVEVVAVGVLLHNRFVGEKIAKKAAEFGMQPVFGTNKHEVELMLLEIVSAKAIWWRDGTSPATPFFLRRSRAASPLPALSSSPPSSDSSDIRRKPARSRPSSECL